MNFAKQNNPVVAGLLIVVLVAMVFVLFKQIQQGRKVQAASTSQSSSDKDSDSDSDDSSSPSTTLGENYVPPAIHRDPFAAPPTPVHKTQPSPAQIHKGVGPVKLGPLPNLVSVMPFNGKNAAKAISAPDWEFTGHVSTTAGRTAVLRCGDMRRYVKIGDTLDGGLKVTDINETTVTVSGNGSAYRIHLGQPASDTATQADGPSRGVASAAEQHASIPLPLSGTTQSNLRGAILPATGGTVPAGSRDSADDDDNSDEAPGHTSVPSGTMQLPAGLRPALR